jgi:hypothetical protein
MEESIVGLRLHLEAQKIVTDWDDIPPHVQKDIDSGYVITDLDDGWQRMKQLSSSTFQYRCELDGKTVEEIIDVDQMETTEHEEALEGFYGSVNQVKEIYGKDANQIIAECHFEYHLL